MKSAKTLYICDRCGKQTTTGWYDRLGWTVFSMWDWVAEKHLCPECMKAFNLFMENKQ